MLLATWEILKTTLWMKGKNNTKWLVFLNIPFQMGVIIGAFVFFGIWLDKKFEFENLFLIIFSLLGVFISLYQTLKTLKNINQNKD